MIYGLLGQQSLGAAFYASALPVAGVLACGVLVLIGVLFSRGRSQ